MGSGDFSWKAMLPAARQHDVEPETPARSHSVRELDVPEQCELLASDEAQNDESTPATRIVSFYHSSTGVFHPRHVMSSDPDTIALNTPAEHIAIDGDHFDPFTQRVDVTTGQIIDQLPPAPSPDHEWSSASRRWQLNPQVLARQQAQHNALARIRQLEVKGMRALREHALGKPGAKHRLNSIDQQIAQLRKILNPSES